MFLGSLREEVSRWVAAVADPADGREDPVIERFAARGFTKAAGWTTLVSSRFRARA
jgi:hypothetical protein